jgi:hypothetical protein
VNTAENALRQAASYGGTPARAVTFLDSWRSNEREEFRNAVHSGDWRRIATLCPGLTDPNQQYQKLVILHLMDATAPRIPSVRQEVDRRNNDRRVNVIAEFTTERRVNDRRMSQRRL